MTEPTAPRIWERMPHEPPKAYAAFVIYRSLGKTRSTREVYELTKGLEPGSKKVGGIPPYFSKWSSHYGWVSRAAAFDEHMLGVAQEAEEEALSQSARMWAHRFNTQREQEFDLAQQLISKVEEMLSFPVAKTVVEEGGRKITVYPTDWKPSDITAFLKTASTLGRLAVGTDQNAPDEGRPQFMKIGNMTIEF